MIIKSWIIKLTFGLTIVCAPMVTLLALYFAMPNEFSETYLGEMKYIDKKSEESEGKKIVLVGGSNIAFGIDVDAMEKETGYTVVPYGLYATLGTKLMLDMSINTIKQGDIVIIAPEVNDQSYSLYFNADVVNQTIGGNIRLLNKVSLDNRKQMLFRVNNYLSKNYSLLLKQSELHLSGVYQRSSFNDNCNLIYDRPNNQMALSYDPSSPISFDSSLLKDDFIDYVNEYSNKVSLKGAKCYFSFSPMNEKALQNYSEENTLAFYKALKSKLKFPVISNPNDYIMDSMYFYDTNYHLNNAGAAIRTNTLINDINRNIGVYTLSNIPIPEIVDDSGNSEPSEEETAVKNFEHADYFEYETIDGSLSIKSVKDEYKDVEELKIPSEYNGQVVKVIQANAFEKCTNLKKISIYSGLQSIIPGAFSGCDKLVGIYLYVGADKVLIDHTGGLLKGADNCSIYVLKEYYTDYVSSYFWGYYVSLIKTFE